MSCNFAAKLHDMYLYKTHQPLFKVNLEGSSLTQVLLYVINKIFHVSVFDCLIVVLRKVPCLMYSVNTSISKPHM